MINKQLKDTAKYPLSKFVVLWTVRYLVNSFNYTRDTGGFELTSNDRILKKLKRLSAGNLLEYYLIYYLIRDNFNFRHDKDSPFIADGGVDIELFLDNSKDTVRLFCKGSAIKSMVGQIRKPLLDQYLKIGGYLLLAYIQPKLIENILKVVEYHFLGNGGRFAENEVLIDVYELDKLLQIQDYGKVMLDGDIKVLGVKDIDIVKDNLVFVKYGEQIPGATFTQGFQEGSYFIKPAFFNELDTLHDTVARHCS